MTWQWSRTYPGCVRGHLRQRGTDSFQLIVYAGRDPVTGKDRYVRRTFKGSKRAAQQALARLVTEVGDGEHVGTDATFADLLERWYERSLADWSPATAREHRAILERHLVPTLGTKAVTKLTTADIDALYARLRTKGSRGKALSAATVRRTHVVVHAALAQAVRWKWLRVNPAAHATPPRVVAPEIVPPAPRDVARLLAVLADLDAPLHAYVRLAATSGARRSQIVGLRWCDIDFEAATATFARSVVLGPSGIEVRSTTKGKRVYRIALDAGTLAVLAEHNEQCRTNAGECGVSLRPDAYVFSNDVEGADPWRPDATTHRFSRVCAKAGLAGVRLHDLRHYVATRMLSSGADVRTVAGRLGHANPSVTLNVYAQFLPQSDRRAAEALGALLDEPEVS
jgi:integrase